MGQVTLDTAGIMDITWTVHLANRKASFFEFQGQRGASDNYEALERAFRNADNRHKRGIRRNADVKQHRAEKLEIDPGPRSTSTSRGQRGVGFLNQKTHIPIKTLGELRTDSAGRLLVIGGAGKSDYSRTLPLPPLPNGDKRNRGDIWNYANNDTWFDDTSDGPVSAAITYRRSDGGSETVKAESAWVLVGPPDFAPSIGNVVTLYDTLWDLAVRELAIPATHSLYDRGAPLGHLRELNLEYGDTRNLRRVKPSYTSEIYPILQRAFSMRWVHKPLNDPGALEHHVRVADFAKLGAIPGSATLRKSIFHRLRDPNSSEFRPLAMPQSFGDNYDLRDRGVASGYLSLTQTQYALMKQWADGNFVADWQGPPPRQEREVITPEGLDRAALENCVGGAFYPGIEASWLIRKKEIFSEPFRIRRGAKLGSLTVEAGFFSQQMALPWQADFYECAREELDKNKKSPIYHAWWPGQRPDDVFLGPQSKKMEDWARGIENDLDNVDCWSTRGFVRERDGGFYETEGPKAHTGKAKKNKCEPT
jgi:hypothetical protein